MLEQEVVDLGEEMHAAFAVAILVTTIDSVILVRIDHQVKLLAIADHGFDELHGVLVVNVVVAATVAKQVVAFDQLGVMHRRVLVITIGFSCGVRMKRSV